MNLANDKYEAMMKRYFDGQCSPEEARELLLWVAESEENRLRFKAAKEIDEIWKLTEFNMPELGDEAIETALAEVNNRIDAAETNEPKIIQMSWVRRNYKYVSGIAAAVVVALVIGFLTMRSMNTPVLVASNGTNTETPYLLPDGSSLTFNGKGEATYPNHFANSSREVDFQGVAYFDIVRDEAKPFVIHCGSMDVEVLGTSFLLNTSNPDKYFVDLYTGKVRLTAFDSKGEEVSQIEVLPGQRGILYLPECVLKALTYPELKAEELKTERVLDFNDVCLSTIVEALEYVYEVNIDLNEAYASERLTARFSDQETIEEVLETIATVFDFSVTMQDDVYLIR